MFRTVKGEEKRHIVASVEDISDGFFGKMAYLAHE
jgi:hypothetical protein